MLVSSAESVLSFSMVAGSIFANASSVGANTVNSPLLSVSTRLTFGLSWPESACGQRGQHRVVRRRDRRPGSCAMPATEPGPSGTCSA